MDDILTRNSIRRGMAFSSMILCWCIILSFLAGLFDDSLADRVAKVWPPFTVMFPALIAQIMHYISVGSSETKAAMAKETP